CARVRTVATRWGYYFDSW
nr:immunoglobulin heavy chain junction region [Macaca mulatta]MOX01844.1 immunoglobulin heavy chain junction region [Macaca mulatta]MOX05815.1 immunoglobulin heavy chain junction region [Macaca mulatta]